MKNLTAKLKGMDYKQLAIDHGEKLVVGLIGLTSLLCVLGARWAPYSKDPEELSKLVSEAKIAISSVKWTDADTEKFTPTSDIRKQAKLLLSSLDGTKYEYDIPFTWPLHEQDKPYSRPTFLAVKNLMARYGRVNIVFRGEAESTGGELDEPGANPDAAGFGGDVDGTDPDTEDFAGDDLTDATEDIDSADEFGDEEGGSAVDAAGQNVQGVRYVSVVGVFPRKNQVDVLKRSMHQIKSAKVAHLIEILDFELQRQTAIAGPNPWGGKWEPADVEFTLEVLRQAEDFDPDIVASGVIDVAITSPLPAWHVIRDKTGKQFGSWGHDVSHPDLENVELTPEEIEQRLLLENRVIELEEREKANRPPQRVQKGGFRAVKKDLRRTIRSLFGGENAETNLEKLQPKNRDERIEQDVIDKLKEEAKAEGRLLLFRYLDFAVEPGNAYRYRVRLILKNPHYDRSPDQLADPDIAVGQTRTTLWSNPTEPVICPFDTDYFLTSVEKRPSRPATASIDVYQWQPEIGATVSKNLPTVVGQFIGRADETVNKVFNPGQKTISEEQVEFKVDDMLVDLSDGPLVRQAEHPDLGLTKDLFLKELSRYSLGVADQALIVNQFGELVALDQVSRRRQHNIAISQQKELFQQFDNLVAKEKEEQPEDDGDLNEFEDDEEEGGRGSRKPSPRARAKNLQKKRDARKKTKRK